MDPGEPGAHGVWIAEFTPGHPVILVQRSISPVHYSQTEIDASWVSDETDFMTALTMGLKEIGGDVQRTHEPGSLREISCRVRLVGRNRNYRLIEGWMDRAQLDLGPIQISPDATIRIDRIESQVRPAIDLEETARGNDLAGETARLILAIDQAAETPAQAAFFKDVAAHAVRVHQHASFTPLALLNDESPVTDAAPDLRQLVREQAWQVLAHLVAQKEPA
jgi:hypothetical protein